MCRPSPSGSLDQVAPKLYGMSSVGIWRVWICGNEHVCALLCVPKQILEDVTCVCALVVTSMCVSSWCRPIKLLVSGLDGKLCSGQPALAGKILDVKWQHSQCLDTMRACVRFTCASAKTPNQPQGR